MSLKHLLAVGKRNVDSKQEMALIRVDVPTGSYYTKTTYKEVSF